MSTVIREPLLQDDGDSLMCELIEGERQLRMDMVRKDVLAKQEEKAERLSRSQLEDRFRWEDVPMLPSRHERSLGQQSSPGSERMSQTRRVSPPGSRGPPWEAQGPPAASGVGEATQQAVRQLEDRVHEMDRVLRTNMMQRLKGLEEQAGQLKKATGVLLGLLFMAAFR